MLWISDEWKEYEVLDASGGERLERWGKFILVRPDPQVIWNTPKTAPQWKRYDARYVRANTGGGHWTDNKLPERWQIHYKDYLTFNVKPMNFKHTGVFPEQAANWDFIREKVAAASARRDFRAGPSAAVWTPERITAPRATLSSSRSSRAARAVTSPQRDSSQSRSRHSSASVRRLVLYAKSPEAA